MLKISIRLLFFSFFLLCSSVQAMMKTFAQRAASINMKARAISGTLKCVHHGLLHANQPKALGGFFKQKDSVHIMAQKPKAGLTFDALKRENVMRLKNGIYASRQLLQSMRDCGQENNKNKRDRYHKQFNAYARYGSLFIGNGVALTILTVEEEKKSAKQRYRYDKACREKARNNYYTYLKSLPWGALAKKYIEEFQQEEKKLMEEFFQLAGISQAQFDNLEAEWYQDLIESEKVRNEQFSILDDQLANTIRQAFTYLGIDAQFLDIRSQQDNTFQAAAGIKTIYVNPDYIPKNAHEHKHIHTLYHEIMHILHEDSLRSNITYAWSNQPWLHSWRTKFVLLIERRADILAALLNIQIAYEAAIHRENDFSDATVSSPAGQVRFAYLGKIYNEMLKDERKKNYPPILRPFI